MHQFTRTPTRYDLKTLRHSTQEQAEARQARVEREQQARLEAVIREERASKPWPVRVVLGFVDVVRELGK